MEIEDRLKALAEQVSPQELKRRAFERLQHEHEDHARILRECAAVFGKPEAVSIRFSDGSVYRTGQFTPAQGYRDFNVRLHDPRFRRKPGDGRR